MADANGVPYVRTGRALFTLWAHPALAPESTQPSELVFHGAEVPGRNPRTYAIGRGVQEGAGVRHARASLIWWVSNQGSLGDGKAGNMRWPSPYSYSR